METDFCHNHVFFERAPHLGVKLVHVVQSQFETVRLLEAQQLVHARAQQFFTDFENQEVRRDFAQNVEQRHEQRVAHKIGIQVHCKKNAVHAQVRLIKRRDGAHVMGRQHPHVGQHREMDHGIELFFAHVIFDAGE